MRQKTIDQFIDMLFDLTDLFWQVGITIAVLSSYATYETLMFAIKHNSEISASNRIASVVLSEIGMIWYLFPIFFGFMAIIFARRAYQVFIKQNHYY
ncbi:MAG: hypothetical protein KZQ83_15900 [gamma proteobacterium symbiont of Taylorina sp.]|nr:hypothetical protein [gamma proteobacterium symbiont of Taylorina sp.]